MTDEFDDLSHVNNHSVDAIRHHPCYSQDAHHYYARMHVAVAPQCNIQCKYCNRKFDCVNESRPGVTSEVLTPEQASQKVLAVGSVLKNVSVVGIAGPGDPLANPVQTFRTFSQIRATAPDMLLCLSTNGLMLDEYIDEICALDIHHVTVTVNAVDPTVSEEIYQFVRWKNKTYRGREAAELLWQQQKAGITQLINRGVLVKVNSVLIPSVNDHHMDEISRTIREMGVFLHNIMPLIIAEGSLYEKAGRVPTSPTLLKEVQERCEPNMHLMRHCRQCRADAIGMLGDDRSKEFVQEKLQGMAATYSLEERAQTHAQIDERMATRSHAIRNREQKQALAKWANLEPFYTAVVSTGDGMVNEHFGHAKEFQIYEVSPLGIRFIAARKVDQYCANSTGSCPEDDSQRLDDLFELIKDCTYLLCMRIGMEPFTYFSQRGIQPIMAYGLIEQELFQLASNHRKLG